MSEDAVLKKRRRKLVFVLLTLLLLLLVVVLIPTLLSTSWGKSWVENKASEKSGMRVRLGDLSLGWWSPAEIQRLTVEDGSKLSIAVDRVKAEYSLWGFLFGRSYLFLEVQRPVIAYKNPKTPATPSPSKKKPKRGDQLEGDFEPTTSEATGEEEISSTKTFSLPVDKLSLVVSQGRIEVLDEASGASATVEKLEISAQSSTKKGPLNFQCSGQALGSAGGTPASSATFSLSGEADLNKASGRISFHLDPMDLSSWKGLAGSQIQELSGKLGCQFEAQWEGRQKLDVKGKLQLLELLVAGPALGSEKWTEKELLLEPQLAVDLDQGQFNLDGFKLSSSFLSAEGKGSVKLGSEGSARLGLLLDMEKLPAFAKSKLPRRIASAKSLQGEILVRTRPDQVPIEGFFEIKGMPESCRFEINAAYMPVDKILKLSSSSLALGESRFENQGRFELKENPAHFEVQGKGHIAFAQLKPYVDAWPSDLEVKGEGQFSWNVKGNAQEFLSNLRTELRGLSVSGKAFAQPPNIPDLISCDLEAKSWLASQKVEITAGKLSVENTELEFRGKADLHPEKFSASLEGNLRGDLANLQRYFPALKISGKLDSHFAVDGGPKAAKAKLYLKTTDFKASHPSLPNPYTEKSISLDCQGLEIAFEPGNFSLEKFHLVAESKALHLEGKAKLDQSFHNVQADLNWKLDADPMAPLFSSLLPKDFSIKGQSQGTLKASGKWEPGNFRALIVQAQIQSPEIVYQDTNWKNGRCTLESKDGILILKELTGDLNGKPVKGSGTVDLNAQPLKFQVQGEFQDIPVKQSFLSALAYPIPILASSESHLLKLDSQLGGHFQIQGQGTDWAQLKKTLSGDGRLALGPGTLAGPSALAKILAGNSSLKFDGLDAPFKLEAGKIVTSGISLKFQETQVTMKGFTTLDGAMDYSVQVQLPPQLQEKGWNQKLEALFGKEGLPVGLGGTVTNPRPTFKMPELKDAGKALLNEALERLKKKKGKD